MLLCCCYGLYSTGMKRNSPRESVTGTGMPLSWMEAWGREAPAV
jgi:hypothetical protein